MLILQIVECFKDLNGNESNPVLTDIIGLLAFGEFESGEGSVFHSHLRCLCHAVPELWVTCARAEAALMAFNGH